MDANVKAIISGDIKAAKGSLKKFLKKNDKLFTFPELKQNNLDQEIWKALTAYLVNPNAEAIHLDVLNTIRILSREKSGLDDVMTDELIETLIENTGIKAGVYFNEPSHYNIELESVKCLCNLIFNSRVASTMCCKNGTLEGITQRLKKSRDMKPPSELLFFDMKILFIISALCSNIRPKLKEDLHGLNYLIEILEHLLGGEGDENEAVTELADLQVNTACEILKTLFNLTLRPTGVSFDEEEEAHLLNLVTILRKYLVVGAQSIERKHELVNHIVNLLTNMPNTTFKNLYVPISDDRVVIKEKRFENLDMEGIFEILEFLRRTLNKEPGVSHQHELLSPVFSSLLRIATVERPIRKYLRLQILPPLKDVHQRPEQGNTLRNCICRLLTTPITQVRDLAAELLFVICKENVNRMIKYTGYGNAAGLFARRGLMGGRPADTSVYSSESDDSDTEEYRDLKHGINPVLGCYEAPKPNPTANMTEEQKEYEAMKLVQLMDDLTKTGVVKPCRIGPDGRPQPVESVMQLQQGILSQQVNRNDSDSD
ncbi:synembryn-like [Atheta coriaria]|uniref:synembryn-like n=1 Tax=Dalotia coriaria TaxID=877792 RepID=UPI0031F3E30C